MIIFIFVFGLAIGSFLNSIIWRLYKNESFLLGRSSCPKCRHALGIRDLIPLLSFLIQRGKCRYCGKNISWQYPLVELITGILFVLVFLKYFSPNLIIQNKNWNLEIVYFFRDLFFVSILIIIFIYDLKYYLIPDKIIIPTLIFILLFNLILILFGGEATKSFLNLFLAGLIGSGFFLIQFLISKGRWIGGGDIRLGLMIGLMLGWPSIITTLVIAYILGAIIGIILIILGLKKMKSMVPFGPFLSLATLITLLYGEKILEWYWKDFSLFLLKA